MNNAKERILITSLALFLKKNFKEVTLKDIVDNSGLSKGAFYHYFSSKEQVFEEVVDHFFMELLIVDYDKHSQISLKQFYHDVLKEIDKKATKLNKLLAAHTDGNSTDHVYYLILNALKILPDFKQKNRQQQRHEFYAWKKIIGTAILTNEIKTKLNDEQVAKLFIYLNDGVNINLIMGNPHNELKQLWDSLYQTLKA